MILLLILLPTILPGLALADSVMVIANPSVPDSLLSKKDVSNIFLGKKSTWDDGRKIVFVILKKSKTHDDFLKTYLSKTATQFDTLWKKKMFTGRGIPPKAMNSDQAMVDFVAKTAGAIGYVSPHADIANVKKIEIQ